MTDPATPLLCSVIIAAHNAAHLLPDCLASLGRQNLSASAFEILVVDDGSTDKTSEVARELGAICLTQPHQGAAAARNHGAREARGGILVFTDADCRPEPDWLATLVQGLKDGAAHGVIGVQGCYATDQKSLTARFAQAEFEDRYDHIRAYPCIDLVATYSAAYRREVFLVAGGFDARFPRADNEDTEFSYRLLAQGHKLALAPRAVVRHLHPATLRAYLCTKCRRGYWRTQVYRLYPDKAFKDRYTTWPVKLGTLTAMTWIVGSLTGLLALPLIGGGLLALAQVCPAVLLGLSWPLARKNWSKDRRLGLATPLLSWLRALALGCGVLGGIVRPAPGLGDGK